MDSFPRQVSFFFYFGRAVGRACNAYCPMTQVAGRGVQSQNDKGKPGRGDTSIRSQSANFAEESNLASPTRMEKLLIKTKTAKTHKTARAKKTKTTNQDYQKKQKGLKRAKTIKSPRGHTHRSTTNKGDRIAKHYS